MHFIEIIVDESAGLMIRLVDEAMFIDVDHKDFVRQILVNGLSIFVVESCIDVIQIVVVEVDVEIADGWKLMGIMFVKCALIRFPVSRFSMRADTPSSSNDTIV